MVVRVLSFGIIAPTFRKFPDPNFDAHSEGDYREMIKPLKAKTALLIIDVQKHD